MGLKFTSYEPLKEQNVTQINSYENLGQRNGNTSNEKFYANILKYL